MIRWLKELFSGPCPLGPKPIDSIQPPGSESCADADPMPESYGGTSDDGEGDHAPISQAPPVSHDAPVEPPGESTLTPHASPKRPRKGRTRRHK